MSEELVNLDGFDLSQLRLIEKQVKKRIDNYSDIQRGRALEEVHKMLEEYEIELKDILNKRTKPTVKYTDGVNVWKGRGKMPAWLKEHIESGKSLEDFLADK